MNACWFAFSALVGGCACWFSIVTMNDEWRLVVLLLTAAAMDVNEVDEDQFEDVADD